MKIVIFVFAYNEEKHIVSAVEHILAASMGLDTKIHVLANGCVDATAENVTQAFGNNSTVSLQEITMPSKVNAWNEAVYGSTDEYDLYLFTDGDVRVDKDSINELIKAYEKFPDKNGYAAVPFSGRSAKSQIETVLREPGIAGNLYALSNHFIHRMKKNNIKLPLHWVGDDSLLGALACTDLGTIENWDYSRIEVVTKAGFSFDQLVFFSFSDLKLYLKRRISYRKRKIENQIMGAFLKEHDAASLPANGRELYEWGRGFLKMQPIDLNVWETWFALRRIRKILNDKNA